MKKSRKKPPRKTSRHSVDPIQLIEIALKKQTKAELLQLLVGFAEDNLEVRRAFENALEIEKPVEFLVHDVEAAIATATDFDERDITRSLPD